ncbi:WbqC family protein [Comamonas sp. UBA7528]|uniref:WbqC family protein n=1 Tax=Comamonas sp. UBA7528 TaxID=1946391 RepID=UPI0025BADB2C|nr:WbqC family protein [Comamonas sp. UBA7528]
MKISVMQPYFMPYIGYFQLIKYSDIFIVYDNIKYTKKGWINRNRMLCQGHEKIFSIPLVKDSDSLEIRDRYISENYSRSKLLNQFHESYKKAPYYNFCTPLLEKIIDYKDDNLFNYILHSIKEISNHLGIESKIIKSSDVLIDHSLRSHEKVIALCKKMDGSDYINPIGGVDLYEKRVFNESNLNLHFLKSNSSIRYKQFNSNYIPWLSIIDMLMFTSPEEVDQILKEEYSLL